MYKIYLSLLIALPMFAQAADLATTINPDELEWQEQRRPGVYIANLLGGFDQEGLYIARMKFLPGSMSTPHSHDKERHITVIKGTWYVGLTEEFDPKNTIANQEGSYMVHPAGMVHYDGAREAEVIVEVKGIGPVKFMPVKK